MMNKMRMTALICVAAMTAGLMAGCGSAASTAAADTSTVISKTAADTSGETEESGSTATTGGWTIFSDETKANIPEGPQAALDKALAAYTGASLTPVAYLGSQIVSGTNYKFLCRSQAVTPDAEESFVTITVYEDLQGNAEITEVKDFHLTDYLENKEIATEDMDGGWTVSENDGTMMEMVADIQIPFDTATENLEGCFYEPVAVLGSQVVAGANYAILCRVTPTTPDATPHFSVVQINAPVSGTASILSICDLDISLL